jgi:hypothetical protein
VRSRQLVRGAGVAAALVLAAVVVRAESTDDGVDLGSWTPAPATLAVDGATDASGPCRSGAAVEAETVLAEQRGPFRLLLHVEGAHVTSCLVAGDAVVASIVGPLVDAPSPGGAGASVLGCPGAAIHRDDVTVIYGFAGGDVDAVVVARSDGVDVEATVTDGWWAAWWPGRLDDDAVLRVLGPEPASTPLVHACRRSPAH